MKYGEAAPPDHPAATTAVLALDAQYVLKNSAEISVTRLYHHRI